MKLNRRGFLVGSGAVLTTRAIPQIAAKAPTRRILTLAYDKSLGMMRAIERVVPK
ncbi:MAG: Tat pathway signal protein [Yoonia sp.]|uniref:Tat pathway signal protein n=1 Tax=Yoonia sp. TaxID=2212373 RepID=UPI003EF2B12F